MSKHLVRGAIRLAGDAVDHGAGAIERVHLATSDRTFAILELFPIVAGPARLVRHVHGFFTKVSYGALRVSARAAAKVAVAVLDATADAETRPTARE
jgi:hypothetical protein